MRLTEQALEQRKEKIIHTAYEMFCELGIDGVNLAEIAKKANVGASAIYRYFDNKTNLLWHTQKILWNEVVNQINVDGHEQLLSAQNGFEEISILLYRFKVLYTRHSSYLLFGNDYKMYLIRNNCTLPKWKHDQLLEPVFTIFQTALRRGYADGSIRREESMENQFFTVWGVMYGFAERIAVYSKMYGESEHWDRQFDLVYRNTIKCLKNE